MLSFTLFTVYKYIYIYWFFWFREYRQCIESWAGICVKWFHTSFSEQELNIQYSMCFCGHNKKNIKLRAIHGYTKKVKNVACTVYLSGEEFSASSALPAGC